MSKNLLKHWEAARDDLGIDIVAPYKVDLGNDVKVQAEILVKNFGGKIGTLVFTNTNAVRPYDEQLCNLGYGWSVLDEPASHEMIYNREGFIDMLSEWEWVGDADKKPSWVKEQAQDSE